MYQSTILCVRAPEDDLSPERAGRRDWTTAVAAVQLEPVNVVSAPTRSGWGQGRRGGATRHASLSLTERSVTFDSDEVTLILGVCFIRHRWVGGKNRAQCRSGSGLAPAQRSD